MPAEQPADYAAAVGGLLGQVPVVRGHEAAFTCPFCGKAQARRKFTVNVTTGLWRCWSCDERGSFPGLWRQMRGDGAVAPHPRPVPPPTDAPAAPERRDRVYRALLTRLELAPHHRDAIVARWFTDEESDQLGCRTLIPTGRFTLARAVAVDLGDSALVGVPGFYWTDHGAALWVPRGGALVIPIRNEGGLIVGLQLRLDDPATTTRYLWLSSGHQAARGGTRARAELHVAWPSGRPDDGLRRALVTEGFFKAMAVAFRLKVLAIALPGVDAWRPTDLVRRMHDLGIEEVVVANDADAVAKVPVARATLRLAESLIVSGLKVSVARWDPACAKGIDDLLMRTDVSFVYANLRDWLAALPAPIRGALTVHRGAFDVPPEAMPPPPAPRPVLTLAEVHDQLRTAFRAHLRRPARGQFHVFTDPPGVGKTTIFIDELVRLRASGWWPPVFRKRRRSGLAQFPMRLVLLFPNKEALAEALRHNPQLAGFAVVQEGRSPDPSSPWHCAKADAAHQVGAQRHSVTYEVCEPCEYREDCPYLASLAEARQADVVLSTHATFVTAADELGPGPRPSRTGRRLAHTVILDEEVVPTLVEEVSLDAGVLGAWREDVPDGEPAAALLDALDHLLAESSPRAQVEPMPALPTLRRVAPARGVDLAGVIATLDAVRQGGHRPDPWPFERPRYRRGPGGPGQWIIPLRGFADLLRIMREELAAQRPDRATRLWLTRRVGSDGRPRPVLLVEVPRQQVIQRLRAATVLHLNATPSAPLLDLVFARWRRHESDIASAVTITQVDNSLYPVAYLCQRGGRALGVVQRLIDAIARRHARPVVFCAKAVEPGQAGVDTEGRLHHRPGGTAQFGHFGAQTRALNRYADADAIVIAGHHQLPPFEAERLVQALRWTQSPRPDPTDRPFSAPRPYAFWRPDGSGRARVVHGHRDAVVQAVLDWSTEAEITQAIGRARACLRPPDRPVSVYLITAAVTGLPIDHLVSAAELLRELGASPTAICRRGGPAAANAHRGAEAAARVQGAIAARVRSGAPVTIAGVSQDAHADRRTVRRVLDVLAPEEMGGGEAGCLKDLDAGSLTTPHFSVGGGADLRGPGELGAVGTPSPTTCGPAAMIAAPSRPGAGSPLQIRWARDRGWIRITDLATGESHELPARDCPTWVYRAAAASRWKGRVA